MEVNQPTVQPAYAPVTPTPPPPNVMTTKIPSVTAFAVGILLFLMPFVDIKCNDMSLMKVTGIELASGFDMKKSNAGNPFSDLGFDKKEQTTSSAKGDKRGPNPYAIVAAILGVLGLALSFANAKGGIGGAMVTGVLSAAALIGLMIDVKKAAKISNPSSGANDKLTEGLDNISSSMNDIKISIEMTPWFYIAVIAFLAAAFFSYRRMSAFRPG